MIPTKPASTALRHLAAALLLAPALAPVPGLAAENPAAFPAHPIRMISASDPGSGSDTISRLIAPALARSLGQPVIVEDIGGAAGTIAAADVAHAPPDGYNILSTSVSGVVLNPILRPGLSYKTTDFAPIGEITESPNIIAVNPSFPATTLPQLITLLKANPGKYNFGSSGIGNINHLQTELFMMRTGTKMVHIPFSGGAGSIVALLGNQIQFNLVNTSGGLSQLVNGTLRPLAVIADQRIPELPGVPAIREIIPDMQVNTVWQGLFAPGGTPRPIIDRISRALSDYMRSPLGIAQFHKIGSVPIGSSPDRFGALVKTDTATWTEVIQKTGIKLQ